MSIKTKNCLYAYILLVSIVYGLLQKRMFDSFHVMCNGNGFMLALLWMIFSLLATLVMTSGSRKWIRIIRINGKLCADNRMIILFLFESCIPNKIPENVVRASLYALGLPFKKLIANLCLGWRTQWDIMRVLLSVLNIVAFGF